HFLQYYLEQDAQESCVNDISDILKFDLPHVEKTLRSRIKNDDSYDAEFAEKIGPLIRDQHFDSAIRRAFVILKERLVKRFDLTSNLDGNDLVNAVFGTKGVLTGHIPEQDQRAMRDLLVGLYGTFRNRYG